MDHLVCLTDHNGYPIVFLSFYGHFLLFFYHVTFSCFYLCFLFVVFYECINIFTESKLEMFSHRTSTVTAVVKSESDTLGVKPLQIKSLSESCWR